MKHLVRAGGVLLALLIIVFVLPRVMPIPVSLEEYGFYPKNSEKNSQEWSNLPVQYVDASICSSCHQDKHSTWGKSKHGTVNCESCHGPGQGHVDKGTGLVVDTSRESCGLCHAKVLARRSDFPQVDLETHGGQSECISCHNPHNPNSKVSTMPTIPHTLEGRDDCLLCHNTGGAKSLPPDHEQRSANTCLNCHNTG